MPDPTRRAIVAAIAAGAAGCSRSSRRLGPTFVARTPSYDVDLAGILERGLKELRVPVRGKSVLLKPNLVEFSKSTCINTDPRVVQAAVEVFQRMGAREVLIGEGPGHRRDTLGLAEEASYTRTIEGFEGRFVDLNRDDVTRVTDFTLRPEFYFPSTLLAADLIVSLAKMKTHHWAGATLSMKNFFGVVPGSVYGWPKNELHQCGIPNSIAALERYFGHKSIGIVDGVVGMEGNGPIQGSPKKSGVIVLGTDLVSLDTTCCRIMGLNPARVPYLQLSGVENGSFEVIEQRGERPEKTASRFELVPIFQNWRL